MNPAVKTATALLTVFESSLRGRPGRFLSLNFFRIAKPGPHLLMNLPGRLHLLEPGCSLKSCMAVLRTPPALVQAAWAATRISSS